MRPADPLANGRRFIAGLFRGHGRRLLLLFLCLLAPLWLFVELADEIHELEDFYFDDALLWHAHALSSPTLDRFFVVVSALGENQGLNFRIGTLRRAVGPVTAQVQSPEAIGRGAG